MGRPISLPFGFGRFTGTLYQSQYIRILTSLHCMTIHEFVLQLLKAFLDVGYSLFDGGSMGGFLLGEVLVGCFLFAAAVPILGDLLQGVGL